MLISDMTKFNSSTGNLLRQYSFQASRVAEALGLFLCLAMSTWILVFLPRGLEFSDTGFYYNSIFNLHDIDMQTTQFAVPLHLISFVESIFVHRVIVLIGLLGCAYAFVRAGHEYLVRARVAGWMWRVRYGALASLIVVPFYMIWVPDPSYNSLGFTMILTLFALAFRITTRFAGSATKCRTEFILAGITVCVLFLARPLAPAVVALAIVPLFLLSARPTLPEIVGAAGWCVAGALGYVLVQAILIEPPWVTVERIQGGLQRRELLARGAVLSNGFESFKTTFSTLFSIYWATLIPFVGALALVLSQQVLPRRWRGYSGLVVLAALFLGLIIVQVRHVDLMAAMTQPWQAALDNQPLSFALIVVATISVALAAAAGLLQRADLRLWLRECVLLAVGLTVCIAAFFGSASGWIAQFSFYSGTILAIIMLVAFNQPGSASRAAHVMLLFLMILAVFPFLKNAYQFPYRLPSSLGQQTEAAPAGRGLAMIRVDPETESLLADIVEARQRFPEGDLAPAIVDLSGRLPLISMLMNASLSRSPWVISAYPGSQELFDYTYVSIDEGTLRCAWILESPDWLYSLDPGVLETRGLDFPGDYELITESWSDYIQSPILLWAPRMNLSEETRC
jgi:hypothetical protein